MKKQKRITIYDIARVLKITPASVSRALNDNPTISEATRTAVKKTATKLNYKKNQQASNLRTGGSKTFGVVVPKIDNNFFSKVISGIEAIANKNNYHVIICQTDEDVKKEKFALETLINQNVACIMISMATTTQSTTHLKHVIDHRIPLIQFDRVDEKIRTNKVINEVESSILAVMQHFAEQGYTRVAHLAGPQHINIFKERKDAYDLGVKKMKFQKRKSWIVYDCLTREASRKATLALLQSDNPPDAIFAAVDLAALGALEAARELNIKVPEQLGICGFSNEPYTELTTPALTTVDQYSYKMGEIAAGIFFEEIQGVAQKTATTIRVVDSKLIVRDSSTRKKKVRNEK